ncbi:unnamed protein product [Oncorhynchus mykiss]|uniref:RGS domain-containing protein n=1 Tax=Oncorhynchus mykiss TaxID=8022 RepID=A0A060VTH6_ONCMY|nr:unnamed protein product [Oncorhynchus mykiss]
MLILVTSPSRELHPLNIDMEDNRRKQTKGCDLRSRLQRRSSHAPNTERLSTEEIILWSQSLERLLTSKYGMATFQAFLKSEFSDENIEFWLICEDYKKIKSSFRLSSRAKKIYKTYIEAEAPKEARCTHKHSIILHKNM